MNAHRSILFALMCVLCAGCQSPAPIATVEKVDLNRFMGSWYVIGNIPTFIEREAFNAVETYRLEKDGTVDTTFTFNKGALDGPKKSYNPRGFVLDTQSNAVWGMRFVWPIKADYRIVYLNPDYTQTIVAREARDYVWIMARTPVIPEADYARLLDFVQRLGYDTSLVRRVPQRAEASHDR